MGTEVGLFKISELVQNFRRFKPGQVESNENVSSNREQSGLSSLARCSKRFELYNLIMKDSCEVSSYYYMIIDGENISVNLKFKMDLMGVAINKHLVEAKYM